MKTLHRALLPIAATVALACLAAAPGAAQLSWPENELAQHARAWFDMLRGDDAAARAFLSEHMAPSALAEASVVERLRRRLATIERTQGLTPLEVVDTTPTSLAVRAHAGNGDDVTVMFEGESASPHRLIGVRIEAGGDAGGGGPRAAPGPPLTDGDAASQIRATLDERAKAGEFSGVALLARSSGTLMAGAWGLADRDRKTPIRTDTRFNFGSIGKIITRTALAQLAEAGKLSLDDKLSKFLPDFPHADSITVDMLCRHRSGVGDFFNDAYRAMDRSKLRHNRDYLALIRDQPLWFAPGTNQRYSNGGYALLGEVIASASGEDYYEYVAKHVLAPAGMIATGFPIEGDGTPGLARGYSRKDAVGEDPITGAREHDNVTTRPARGSAAGGGYTTATDLLAFDRALLSAKLCGPAWSAWVTGGPRPAGTATKGVEPARAQLPPGGEPAEPVNFGFAGGAPGISAEWLHEGDVTLIVLTNRDPETSQRVMEPVQKLVRRMKQPGRKVNS
jgi:CubicO group peptidase (beta-lactamase class C family)